MLSGSIIRYVWHFVRILLRRQNCVKLVLLNFRAHYDDIEKLQKLLRANFLYPLSSWYFTRICTSHLHVTIKVDSLNLHNVKYVENNGILVADYDFPLHHPMFSDKKFEHRHATCEMNITANERVIVAVLCCTCDLTQKRAKNK